MSKSAFHLSLPQARRIALYAQGFQRPRPTGRVDRRHLRRAVDDMGLIQIDSVNVLVRSQELTLFSRLGDHPRSLIEDATADGELFEQWVHEASHVPVRLHPYLRHRMSAPHRWKGYRRWEAKNRELMDAVLERLEVQGAMVAGELGLREGAKEPWWDWDDGKRALECLFKSGEVAATRRASDFARVYDLAERVIPEDVLAMATPSESEQRKALLLNAAKHHGVGTLEDLADYHRQRNPPVRPLISELVEEGRLVQGTVAGWSKPALMLPSTVRPRSSSARALLSPFDPVVWNRDRTERLFDFHYRIEIYVPKPKRRFGYFVLPFLLGDALVARVDLKADRGNRRLLVQGSYVEEQQDADVVAEALSEELALMAQWLGLDNAVVVKDQGNLASRLKQTVVNRG